MTEEMVSLRIPGGKCLLGSKYQVVQTSFFSPYEPFHMRSLEPSPQNFIQKSNFCSICPWTCCQDIRVEGDATGGAGKDWALPWFEEGAKFLLALVAFD